MIQRPCYISVELLYKEHHHPHLRNKCKSTSDTIIIHTFVTNANRRRNKCKSTIENTPTTVANKLLQLSRQIALHELPDQPRLLLPPGRRGEDNTVCAQSSPTTVPAGLAS